MKTVTLKRCKGVSTLYRWLLQESSDNVYSKVYKMPNKWSLLWNCKLKVEVKWLIENLVFFLHLRRLWLFILLEDCFLSFLWLLDLFELFLFLGNLSVHYSAPVAINTFRDPVLHFESRYSLHSKNFKSYVVSSRIRIRYSINSIGVTIFCMGYHRIDWGEFLWTFRAVEMPCLLMVMQNNLIFEWLLAIVAKRSHTWHITLLAPHHLSVSNEQIYYKCNQFKLKPK